MDDLLLVIALLAIAVAMFVFSTISYRSARSAMRQARVASLESDEAIAQAKQLCEEVVSYAKKLKVENKSLSDRITILSAPSESPFTTTKQKD